MLDVRAVTADCGCTLSWNTADGWQSGWVGRFWLCSSAQRYRDVGDLLYTTLDAPGIDLEVLVFERYYDHMLAVEKETWSRVDE